ALTVRQVQALNTAVIDLGYLTPTQCAQLTLAQVQALPYTQFWHVPAALVPELTPAQVGTLPSTYWLSLMPADARAALTAAQVQALNTAVIDLGYLTPTQCGQLTLAQVQALPYTQFWHVPAALVPELSPAQVGTLPSTYWLSLMTADARAALTAAQVQALNTAVIDLGYLTPTQCAQLTLAQVQALPYTQFWHLTAAQVYLLTDDQVSSITSNYWILLMSPQAQAALIARK